MSRVLLPVPFLHRSHAGVYLFIKHGEVVYVGQSNCVPVRVRTHMVNGFCRGCSRRLYVSVPHPGTRASLEQVLIERLNPSQNNAPGWKGSGSATMKALQLADSVLEELQHIKAELSEQNVKREFEQPSQCSPDDPSVDLQ